MECLFNNLHSDRKKESIEKEAFELFLNHYRLFWDESWDLDNSPKDPANAELGIKLYMKGPWEEDRREMEVLYTEVCGSVPVDEDHLVHFKIDVIARDRDGIVCVDHKTTKTDSTMWDFQWDLSLQMNTYIHALYCIYPPDEVFGMKVNGVVLRKPGGKGIAFKRIPVCKTKEQMLVWLWNMQHRMQMLDWNIKALSECSVNDEVMRCFPMRTKSCTDWHRECPYHTFCTAWTNPLQRCEHPPPGFEIRHWNPRDQFEDAKYILVDDRLKAT